jgi:hypothetical protein
MAEPRPPPSDDNECTLLDPKLSLASQGMRSASAAAVDTTSHALQLGTRLHEFEIVSVLGWERGQVRIDTEYVRTKTVRFRGLKNENHAFSG